MSRMIALLFLLASTSVFGCASTPTVGDSMKAHGEVAEQIGKQWNQGEKMLKRGEKMREQGIGQEKDAVKKQEKAEDLITRGKELMAQSQTKFSTQFPASESSNSTTDQ